MLSAHEKLTNEAGETFVLLPLEEYNALFGVYPEETEEISTEEANAIHEGLTDIKNGEVISATDVATQLGLSLNTTVSKT